MWCAEVSHVMKLPATLESIGAEKKQTGEKSTQSVVFKPDKLIGYVHEGMIILLSP